MLSPLRHPCSTWDFIHCVNHVTAHDLLIVYEVFNNICAVKTIKFPVAEEFGTSKQKLACEQSCPEPCEHVEYETAFSYSGLYTETLDDYLMEFLKSTANTSVDRTIYEPLLNMTQSEREKYIE